MNSIGWKSELGDVRSCNCIGPQSGYPRCPCAMRGLIQRNGRWIEPEKDLGPVSAVAAAFPKADKEQG